MSGKFVFLTIGFAISFQAMADEPTPSMRATANTPPLLIPAPPSTLRKKDRRPEGGFSLPSAQTIPPGQTLKTKNQKIARSVQPSQ